jgi:hypothetical protein
MRRTCSAFRGERTADQQHLARLDCQSDLAICLSSPFGTGTGYEIISRRRLFVGGVLLALVFGTRAQFAPASDPLIEPAAS